MKASSIMVRCGVVVRYCCHTWCAIWYTEELEDRTAGPEEREEEPGVCVRLGGMLVNCIRDELRTFKTSWENDAA
jgi:hypothetical protein